MAIFRRDDPPSEPPPARTAAPQRSESAPSATRIAPGSRFEGRLEGGTDVVIEGELTGQVVLGSALTIGGRGRVQARVHARSVRVGGELHGDVVVEERLEVLPGGKLEGDVRAPRVAIAEGGFFRGHIDMGSMQGAKAEKYAAAAGPAKEPLAEVQSAASRAEEAGTSGRG
ncbi:MAG TPA: polymer-forming cytoskeletal protein [Thermoanaerobaculia bacterium]|nr:polymer-forming cytoskeletal protein [Thermoanaerobaculia bacterium]